MRPRDHLGNDKAAGVWQRLAGGLRASGTRPLVDQLFKHGWWIAAALTLALIVFPSRLVQRFNLMAYDAMAGEFMGSDLFTRWQASTRSGPQAGNSGKPPRSDFSAVPQWAGPADHQAIGVPGSAVIVAIDDASLQAFGHWPWPRQVHARLIETLQEAGVNAIAYDVQFSEASASSAAGHDEALARAVGAVRNVVLPVYARVNADGASDASALQGPLPELRRNAAALGHAALLVDDDGASRRTSLDLQIDGRQMPSLPMAMWTLNQSDLPPAELQDDTRSAADLLIGQRDRIRIFPGRDALMPAGGRRVPQFSAAQVLMDPQIRADLRGRAIWVGVTATGLSEPISTPAAHPESQWSRLRWQAQTYEALRTDSLIQPLDQALTASAVVPPMLLMALIAGRRGASTRGRWGMLLVALPLLSTLLLLVFARAWMPPAAATIGWCVGYALWRGRHLHQQREALDRWQQRADATLHAIADGVISVDAQGRIEYVNPVTARWLETPLRQMRGRTLRQVVKLGDDARDKLERLLWDCLERREVSSLLKPIRVSTPDGMRSIAATATPVLGGEAAPATAATSTKEEPAGAVLILSDVTEQLQSARRLHHEATHDALTGLLNRAGLSERLQQALETRLLAHDRIALMFIDLDRFKRINDSLGHLHGDTVLQTIAHRLVNACNPTDAVARWGGDEFVILATDCHELAERAQRIVESISVDLRVDEVDMQCGCSIGIAVAPEDGTTLQTLLARADQAMFASKAQGGRRFNFFAREGSAWTRDSLRMETRLRRSLNDGTLALHYQPQVQLKSGQTVGMEALLRWHQPDGSIWSPKSFLSIAESSDVILPIGEWVIHQAIRQVAAWIRLGLPVVPISVNVSARQCLDLHLVDLIERALVEHNVPANLVKVEVTETTAMSDVSHVSKLLHDLRRLGVAVAVDDFGTGYSSLAHLRLLPVDQIKIDQSFVRDIASDRYGAAVVRAMITLAHELGVPVVAEGVESQTQMNFLTLHECDIGQGYYYAHPLDGLTATEYLQTHFHPAQGDPRQRKLALH